VLIDPTDSPSTEIASMPPDLSSRGRSRTLKDLPAADGLLPKLGRYTEGVGCIYAKKLEDIDLDVLRRLIAIAWARGDDPEPA
jgi:hypothetical protein